MSMHALQRAKLIARRPRGPLCKVHIDVTDVITTEHLEHGFCYDHDPVFASIQLRYFSSGLDDAAVALSHTDLANELVRSGCKE